MAAVGVQTGGANVQFAVNPTDGRVLVIDAIPPTVPGPHDSKTMDFMMLGALTGGERTAAELEPVVARAGLRLCRVVPTCTPMSVAVAVAAFFLGNSFLGGRSLTSRLTGSTMATAQRISTQAMRYAMLAQVIFGRDEVGFVQAQTATACAQTRLAVVQTAMAHREAALARVQAERSRVPANRGVVAWPWQNLLINLPDVPVIAAEGTI